MTTTVWAVLGNAFYLALVLNGWVRADDYVDAHGLVAMVPMVAELKNRLFLDPHES
jgi:hypothetical protein